MKMCGGNELSEKMGRCFFITPFRPPTHHYLYLFLKEYLEINHNLILLRADKAYSEKGFVNKIIRMIDESELVIADITGNNPNVFYEIGVSHTKKIPVILISGETPRELPSDIRHIDCLFYNNNEKEFIEKLNQYYTDIIIEKYNVYYEDAKKYAEEFKSHSSIEINELPKDEFIDMMKIENRTTKIPTKESIAYKAYLTFKYISNSSEVDIGEKLNEWLEYSP